MGDVYEKKNTGGISKSRKNKGIFSFLTGLIFLVSAMIIGTTSLFFRFGLTIDETQEIGGVLAALGLLAVFGSSLLVSKNVLRKHVLTYVLGTFLTFAAIAIFTIQFPQNWTVNELSSIPLVSFLMLCGTSLNIYTVFWVIIRFKIRNSPGGTVQLTIEEDGKTRTVTVQKSVLENASREKIKSIASSGGIGLLGSDPDGNVKTQTNNTELKSHESDAELLTQDD